MDQPLSIQCIVETALYADDLDEMQAFYEDVLQFPLLGKEPGRHVFFRVGAAQVLLIFRPESTLLGDFLPAHGTRGPGHLAFGIATDQLAAWRQRLVAKAVAIEHEHDWPRGGKSIYFRDPAGNAVELITPGIWGTPAGW